MPPSPSPVGWAGRLPVRGASRFYVGNVNEFHRLGGYDAILKRVAHLNHLSTAVSSATASTSDLLESPGSADPLSEISVYAAIIYVPRVCYTERWARDYYQPIRDVLLSRVLALTDGQVR